MWLFPLDWLLYFSFLSFNPNPLKHLASKWGLRENLLLCRQVSFSNTYKHPLFTKAVICFLFGVWFCGFVWWVFCRGGGGGGRASLTFYLVHNFFKHYNQYTGSRQLGYNNLFLYYLTKLRCTILGFTFLIFILWNITDTGVINTHKNHVLMQNKLLSCNSSNPIQKKSRAVSQNAF